MRPGGRLGFLNWRAGLTDLGWPTWPGQDPDLAAFSLPRPDQNLDHRIVISQQFLVKTPPQDMCLALRFHPTFVGELSRISGSSFDIEKKLLRARLPHPAPPR